MGARSAWVPLLFLLAVTADAGAQGCPGGPRALTEARPISAAMLSYPLKSQQRGEQGTVIVRVYVEATGEASRFELERSSGYERLDKAALRAASAMRFKPATHLGEPVASSVIVPMVFSLAPPPTDGQGVAMPSPLSGECVKPLG